MGGGGFDDSGTFRRRHKGALGIRWKEDATRRSTKGAVTKTTQKPRPRGTCMYCISLRDTEKC